MTEENLPVAKKSLLEWTVALKLIHDEIGDADEITPELMQKFEAGVNGLAAKTDNYGWFKKVSEDIVAGYDREIKAATAAKKRHQAVIKRLEERAKFAMEIAGEKVLKGDDWVFSLKKNPGKPNYRLPLKDVTTYRVLGDLGAQYLEDPAVAPYLKKEVLVSIDHDKVRADLQAGMKLSFADWVEDPAVTVKRT